ncbi:hypothetical protein F0562_026290 [Nyssa sinensis]|uniref:Protein kinase domain-containing protein n=1 Tax=Nyssa sinensis TaxID=561372 RepID=A0A5J5BAC8_9ASTE|nr:hypothetical protein F0562_026290 [Nyssa sinensis]
MSTNGDVYNYGILLLEMMTGKSPTNSMFVEGLNLHNFSRMALPDRVLEVVDPFLQNNDNKESKTMAANNYNRRLRQTSNGSRTDCLISVIKIGVACSMESPQHRMNIKYGLGSDVSIEGDIYSYGILLLEMITRKKPTDPMFDDGLEQHNFARVALPGILLLEVLTGKRPILDDDDILDLHSFARKALPDRVMEIVDPLLLKDLENDLAAECLISMVRIGVACSMKSPQDRMDIKKVIDELNLVRDILQGTRKRPTRRRPTLDLRMSWLVSLEKSNRQEESSLPNFDNSYCQEESESYSQGEPCLPIFENSYSQEESESCSQEESESYSQGEPCPPIFENSYCQEESESYSQGEPCLPIFENSFNQEESWLPNFENSFSQEESWLPNFEKSYIYSGRQETSFPTQKMFSNFVPLLPKPAPLLPWEGPSWISFEESYRREEPKSEIHGKPWIPKFEKSLSEKES